MPNTSLEELKKEVEEIAQEDDWRVTKRLIEKVWSLSRKGLREDVNKILDSFEVKIYPNSDKSRKELSHQKEIVLEIWKTMIKPIIKEGFLSLLDEEKIANK